MNRPWAMMLIAAFDVGYLDEECQTWKPEDEENGGFVVQREHL